MSDIYLEDLVYFKPEIDGKLEHQKDYTDTELGKKAEKVNVGAPGGIATLSPSGTVPLFELPIGSNMDAFEGVKSDVLVTPSALKYAVQGTQVLQSSLGQADGVCPLGSDAKINPSYLPPAPQVNVIVVDTLTDMNTTTIPVGTGDRCIVTKDPADVNGDINGEYVATVDQGNITWDKLPSYSAVSSVNGQTGIVDIVSTQQGDMLEQLIMTVSSDIGNLDINIVDLRAQMTNVTDDLNDIKTDLQTAITSIIANANLVNDTAANFVALSQITQDLKDQIPFTPFYAYETTENFVVENDIYETVGFITPTDQDDGIYEYTISMLVNLDSDDKLGYVRFSTDQGITWQEIMHDPKTPSTTVPIHYKFIKDHIFGPLGIIVQARKEDATTTLTHS